MQRARPWLSALANLWHSLPSHWRSRPVGETVVDAATEVMEVWNGDRAPVRDETKREAHKQVHGGWKLTQRWFGGWDAGGGARYGRPRHGGESRRVETREEDVGEGGAAPSL